MTQNDMPGWQANGFIRKRNGSMLQGEAAGIQVQCVSRPITGTDSQQAGSILLSVSGVLKAQTDCFCIFDY